MLYMRTCTNVLCCTRDARYKFDCTHRFAYRRAKAFPSAQSMLPHKLRHLQRVHLPSLLLPACSSRCPRPRHQRPQHSSRRKLHNFNATFAFNNRASNAGQTLRHQIESHGGSHLKRQRLGNRVLVCQRVAAAADERYVKGQLMRAW